MLSRTTSLVDKALSQAESSASRRPSISLRLHVPRLSNSSNEPLRDAASGHLDGKRSLAPGETWMVPSTYMVPRKVVVKCLEEMDSAEQPDKPGMLSKHTLRQTVERFNGVFNRHVNREDQVAAVMDHLERHTRRRRGETALKAGLLEWEQTSRVYELFSVHLNICERILFTMDFAVRTTILSRVCSTVLISCIFVSIIVWMVSTLPSMRYVQTGCTSLEVGQCQPRP
ncbi:unnamed protein product, partial [Effrenium voratum]